MNSRFRIGVLNATLIALCVAMPAPGGQNPVATLPLHGKVSISEPCTGYLPVDCVTNMPVVNVPAGPVAVFLFVANYNCLSGVQTAFGVDPSWTFSFGLWDCQPGQLTALLPAPPFGPTTGTLTTTFNFLNGPALAVIGRMFFVAGPVGCIDQVQSSYPFGTHLLDCQHGIDVIGLGLDLGRVCVGQGGFNACWPNPAVEPATWGSIKAHY